MGHFLGPGVGGSAPPGLSLKGFFGGQPVPQASGLTFNVTGISFGSSGPSFNGPGQSNAGGASSRVFPTPSGFISGTFAPDPFSINGVGMVAFGQFSTSPDNIPPNGLCFMLILNQAGLPQDFFTSIDFTLGNGNAYSLTSAGAMFNSPWDDTATGTGFTTWVWVSNEGFFPPPSWPNPVTVVP